MTQTIGFIGSGMISGQRPGGAITPGQQALAEGRTAALYARMEDLRQRVARIEDELHETRRQIVEAQA